MTDAPATSVPLTRISSAGTREAIVRTLAEETPSILPTIFSMRAEQAAQVIPVMEKVVLFDWLIVCRS